jgi:hypothetical protein
MENLRLLLLYDNLVADRIPDGHNQIREWPFDKNSQPGLLSWCFRDLLPSEYGRTAHADSS